MSADYQLRQCTTCGIAFHEVDPLVSPPPDFSGHPTGPRSDLCNLCIGILRDEIPIEHELITGARAEIYSLHLRRGIAAG